MRNPKTSMNPGRVLLLIASAVTALAMVVAACGGSASTLSKVGAPIGNGSASGGEPIPAATSGGLQAGGSTDGSAGGSGSGTGQNAGNPVNDVSRPDLLIIKTGSLSLQVAGLDDALSAASTKIDALGGYSSGSERSGDDADARAQVTYRIPSARWDEALAALRGLGSKVLAEQSQSQDVTGQVVDLGARITNLQATEKALQAIMDRATKIADVLAVQSQLTDVRGQIELLSTQKAHLQEQASFSTLTVTYSLKPPPAVTTTAKGFDPAGEVDRATASLVGILQALAAAGIWLGIVWLPILLALAVIGLIGWFIIRRVARPEPPSSTIEPSAQA
jgi:Domain of unknown function (DUF4349)